MSKPDYDKLLGGHEMHTLAGRALLDDGSTAAHHHRNGGSSSISLLATGAATQDASSTHANGGAGAHADHLLAQSAGALALHALPQQNGSGGGVVPPYDQLQTPIELSVPPSSTSSGTT